MSTTFKVILFHSTVTIIRYMTHFKKQSEENSEFFVFRSVHSIMCKTEQSLLSKDV